MSQIHEKNHGRDYVVLPKVRWAIIGLGDVCTIKSGPAFYKSHGSTLSAVMRRTPGKAQEWIDQNIQEGNFPQEVEENIRGFESVETLMDWALQGQNGNIDAIYVATPPGAHLEVIRQIANAIKSKQTNGDDNTKKYNHPIRAIYVEKPVGRCAWETRSIIDELQSATLHIPFYPAYVSRAHERTQVLRKLLSAEKICGDLITNVKYTMRGSSLARGLDESSGGVAGGGGSFPWRLVAKQSGGGLIMDMGCHVLDRIDYLFGPIVNVQSQVLRKGGGDGDHYPLVEDFISMTGNIGSSDWAAIPSEKAKVECLWDFSPPKDANSKDSNQDELIIQGTEGSLRMAGMGAGLPIEVLDKNGQLVRTIEFEAPKHAAQPLIQSIANEIRGATNSESGGKEYGLFQCPAKADNAIRTSEVLDAILNSYYGGRHDEFWLREDSWPGVKN